MGHVTHVRIGSSLQITWVSKTIIIHVQLHVTVSSLRVEHMEAVGARFLCGSCHLIIIGPPRKMGSYLSLLSFWHSVYLGPNNV